MHAPSPPAAVAKALRQPALFGAQLKRGELAALSADWPLTPIAVQVVRNTAFEFVASATPAFLSYADLAAEWRYSDYDDSLSFAEPPGDTALVLVWLDFERYRMADEALVEWVAGRVAALRALTPAPILVADRPCADKFNAQLREALKLPLPPITPAKAGVQSFPERSESGTDLDPGLRRGDRSGGMPGVFLYPRSAVAGRLGERYRDARLAASTGSDLSNAAALEHARDLGLVWIPSLVSPPLKCLALDLDNTLYGGVLGEDSPAGVQFTDAHARLQSRLVDLWAQGLLLALISKNEPADVEALFDARFDFPLRPEHISARAIGWGAKSAGLGQISRALNIGPEAILLLDDNLGEIAEVAAALPTTPCLHTPDPEATLRALDLTPGLMRLSADAADRLRATDLAVRDLRLQQVSTAPDPAAYHAALHTRLTYARAGAASIERLQALSIKTNQFNLALARLTHAQAQAYLDDPDRRAFGVALSDDLSDSGVIAAIFVRRDGEGWVVDDLCISCRALGRGLEDEIVLGALEGLGDTIGFAFAEGPRNQPARAWLERLSGAPLPDAPGIVRAATNRERLAAVKRVWTDG